jgi:hypothetical protein
MMWFEYAGFRYEYIDEGAFGAIFKNNAKNTVIKLFQAMTERRNAELTYQAEVEAYVLLSSSAMSDLAPRFIGRLDQPVMVQDLPTNHQGFHNDLGYEMEFLSGRFVKVGAGSEFSNLAVIRMDLRQIGIAHTSDISVLESDGAVTKIIDFATHEIQIWHKDNF